MLNTEALSTSAAGVLGGVCLTSSGILAGMLGTIVWTDFHGVAQWATRAARFNRDVEPEDAEESIEHYRYLGAAIGVVGGGVAFVFGLILLVRSAM